MTNNITGKISSIDIFSDVCDLLEIPEIERDGVVEMEVTLVAGLSVTYSIKKVATRKE